MYKTYRKPIFSRRDVNHVAVVFDASLKTCLERNKKRERQVPEYVIRKMHSGIYWPTTKERFSKIIVIKEEK